MVGYLLRVALVGSKSVSGIITSSFQGPTHVGSNDGSNEKKWAGKIRALIFDVALPQDQISSLSFLDQQ